LLRYSARSISNIKVKEGPLFIRSRLYTLGFRPINNVVDITNYILLESGHPLHAFDRSLLEEDRIVIRNALEGEELTALNGSKLKLSSNDLIIADGKRPVALAGVIGGANSEVSDATTSIILEAAIFDPVTVRRSSKSHQISTESSYRFERGVDIDSILVAQARALTLLAKYADGVVSPDGVDIYPDKKKGLQVPIRFKKVRDIYLDSIDNKTIVDILTRLGLLLVEQDEVAAKFEIPSFRHDLEREIDLVEEVARINGYDKVIATTPLTPPDTTGKSSLHKLSNKARAHLRSRGMLEGLGLSFMNEEDFRALCYSDSEIKSALKIDNPMNSEWTFLRTTLMKSLLNSASRLGSESIFEIGVVFSNDPSDLDAKPTERLFLSGIFSSKQPLNLWNKKLGDRDFYDLSGVVEDLLSAIEFHNCYQLVATGRSFFYPNRQSEIIIDSNLVGCFGQIHPSSQENFDLADPHFIFELDLTKIATIKKNPIVYKKIVKFPIVKRDLAILVDHNLEIGKIKEAIYEFGGPKLITATLFDIFRSEKIGNDKKSVAFGLEFQDSNSTLRDDDVDQIFDKIVRKLDEKFQASLR
ncbi:MAG: phenylalanine--tRNA ligase subunit beta, partial [Nitrospinota bacterium]